MKNKVVRKLLMIGLSSSVALTSTVGVTAASMDTALEAVAEDETEAEETDSEEDVTEETTETETEEVTEETTEDAGAGEETTKLVYLHFIKEDDKTPFGNVVRLVVDINAKSIHTSDIPFPEGWEWAQGTGDISIGSEPGADIDIEIREKAPVAETRKVYVSLIDADDKTAVGAPQTIEIGAKDTTFHTDKLTLPENYEFVIGKGDVYVGEGDSVNVEVRKKAPTAETRKVYVSLDWCRRYSIPYK